MNDLEWTILDSLRKKFDKDEFITLGRVSFLTEDTYDIPTILDALLSLQQSGEIVIGVKLV